MAHEPNRRQRRLQAGYRDETGKHFPPELLLPRRNGRALGPRRGPISPNRPQHVPHTSSHPLKMESSLPRRLHEVVELAAAAHLLAKPRGAPPPNQRARSGSTGDGECKPRGLRSHATRAWEKSNCGYTSLLTRLEPMSNAKVGVRGGSPDLHVTGKGEEATYLGKTVQEQSRAPHSHVRGLFFCDADSVSCPEPAALARL